MVNLKRPENINGYVHPENVFFSKKSIYKTFTEGEKSNSKSIQNFGNTTGGNHYVNYGDIVDEKEEEITENFCPKCNQRYISVSNCVYNFKTCSNGHVWYLDRTGNIKLGKPR